MLRIGRYVPISGQACNPPDPQGDIFLSFVVEESYRIQYQSDSNCLPNVGSGFHCLRGCYFSFLRYVCVHALTEFVPPFQQNLGLQERPSRAREYSQSVVSAIAT
jgi:hypothetical protein